MDVDVDVLRVPGAAAEMVLNESVLATWTACARSPQIYAIILVPTKTAITRHDGTVHFQMWDRDVLSPTYTKKRAKMQIAAYGLAVVMEYVESARSSLLFRNQHVPNASTVFVDS